VRVRIPKSPEQLNKDEILRKKFYIKLTTAVLSYLTKSLVNRGFEWYLPVILSKSTDPLWPDPGASIEKRVEFEIYESKVRTTLSMIVHKVIACSLYSDRLFIISPNLRIERRERAQTGWHAYEFNQLDFEMKDATSKDVMKLVEEVLEGLISHIENNFSLNSYDGTIYKDIAPPFKVYDREELISKFGTKWEEIFPSRITEPVWIVNIPREFYDFQNFENGKWDNFDLYVPKYGEILSGARREWEYNKILTKMKRDGVKKENYNVLLELARKGKIRQSSGAGLGIERLVAWLTNAWHVCEVQPFPRVPGLVYEL
jgi:asparaginyl-tRNA synthetase